MEAVYRQSLMQLQPLIPQMGGQVISNILWSSARVGFSPNEVVPGMVCLLTRSYLQLVAAGDTLEDKQALSAQSSANFMWALFTMDPSAATLDVMDTVLMHFACLNCSSDVRRRPNAQEVANVMWASAQLQRTCSFAPQLLDPLCDHFAHLLRSPDARQRPTAQDCSIMMWSQATIGHPAAAKLLNALCVHFAQLMDSPDVRQHPGSQNIANVMWALAKLKHTPQDSSLLDRFCLYFCVPQSRFDTALPEAQAIGNVLLALAELRHVPPDAAASAMLQRFIALCNQPGQQPNFQGISNTICACAELRLRLTQQEACVLLTMLLDMPATRVGVQHYCNSAWGLAVMQHLTVMAFSALLDRLSDKLGLPPMSNGPQRPSAQQLLAEEARQLYQALAWLKPLQRAEQMEAWSSLHSRLHSIVLQPESQQLFLPGLRQLHATLTERAPFQPEVQCPMYSADAMLSRGGAHSAPVILKLEHRKDFMVNVPHRCITDWQ